MVDGPACSVPLPVAARACFPCHPWRTDSRSNLSPSLPCLLAGAEGSSGAPPAAAALAVQDAVRDSAHLHLAAELAAVVIQPLPMSTGRPAAKMQRGIPDLFAGAPPVFLQNTLGPPGFQLAAVLLPACMVGNVDDLSTHPIIGSLLLLQPAVPCLCPSQALVPAAPPVWSSTLGRPTCWPLPAGSWRAPRRWRWLTARCCWTATPTVARPTTSARRWRSWRRAWRHCMGTGGLREGEAGNLLAQPAKGFPILAAALVTCGSSLHVGP